MARTLTATAAFIAALSAALAPWLDLAIRLSLARAFLGEQLHEAMTGDAPASPVWSGLAHAVMASTPGAAIQALCPLLLAVGLFARPVAAAMLLQVLLAPPTPAAALFQAALLLRIVVVGAGALSLDRPLGRGAESLAIPGLARASRALARAGERLAPIYRLVLRVWLAAALAGLAFASLAVTQAMRPENNPWLPHVPAMLATLPPWLALGAAVLLAAGAGTRLVAAALLALVPFGAGTVLDPADARLYWALLLGVLLLRGAGALSVDRAVGSALARMAPAPDRSSLPHVVIVGGGFGGIEAARGLAHAPCRVTVIDRRNHHLFQPLLYQVATAGLSPADIATPVREMLRDQDNARVLLGEVTGVDAAARQVVMTRGAIAFDYLVIATGARHGYFGRDDWAPFAPGLKSIEDATAIRRRLLLAFEEAEDTTDAAERRVWLTFVVVGGGPTGVELAGAIAELARNGMTREFREIDPASARVILVQSAPRLLPAFPPSLSAEAARDLESLGVEVRLDRKVEAVDATGVVVSGEALPARTVLWAAGVMASPAASWLGVTPDRAGRVKVGDDLTVPGLPRIYVVGDTAASLGWAGKEVPGLAPAAKQAGAYAARAITAALEGRRPPPPFRYRHFGSLATIGRRSAVADFGFVRLRGALAWWLWGAAHIAFLVGGRNRAIVLIQWLWAYLTFRRGTRLITERG
jgi:NADH dehydrogenase/putative oxidoreductase